MGILLGKKKKPDLPTLFFSSPLRQYSNFVVGLMYNHIGSRRKQSHTTYPSAVTCSTVSPSLSFLLRSAPLSTSSSTHSRWPPSAATSSGVERWLSWNRNSLNPKPVIYRPEPKMCVHACAYSSFSEKRLNPKQYRPRGGSRICEKGGGGGGRESKFLACWPHLTTGGRGGGWG